MCLFSGTVYGVTIIGIYTGRESNWCIFHCFRNIPLDMFVVFFFVIFTTV